MQQREPTVATRNGNVNGEAAILGQWGFPWNANYTTELILVIDKECSGKIQHPWMYGVYQREFSVHSTNSGRPRGTLPDSNHPDVVFQFLGGISPLGSNTECWEDPRSDQKQPNNNPGREFTIFSDALYSTLMYMYGPRWTVPWLSITPRFPRFRPNIDY